MRIRTLGRSGLRVSELCLGTMTFGMLDDTLAAAGTSVPEAILARRDEASAIVPEYPNAFIDIIQHWLGNR